MAEKTTTTTTQDATVVKTADDLHKELAAKRHDLAEARRSHAAGELANPNVLGAYRKDIARLLTQLNEKESK